MVSALAAITERVEIGTLVTPAGMRNATQKVTDQLLSQAGIKNSRAKVIRLARTNADS